MKILTVPTFIPTAAQKSPTGQLAISTAVQATEQKLRKLASDQLHIDVGRATPDIGNPERSRIDLRAMLLTAEDTRLLTELANAYKAGDADAITTAAQQLGRHLTGGDAEPQRAEA